MTAIAPNPTPSPAPPRPPYDTLADLLRELGGIAPERVLLWPYPGTATDEDALTAESRFGRLCELIDGVLVEKPMGFYESRLAWALGYFLEKYNDQHPEPVCMAFGGDGQVRTDPRRVRLPDVAIYLWSRFPGGLLPAGQILELPPDLPVEVISPGNTVAEMDLKRQEYFRNGAALVWFVYPDTRTVRVYSAPDRFTELTEANEVDGAPVLPGFRLSIAAWFRRAGVRAPE